MRSPCADRYSCEGYRKMRSKSTTVAVFVFVLGLSVIGVITVCVVESRSYYSDRNTAILLKNSIKTYLHASPNQLGLPEIDIEMYFVSGDKYLVYLSSVSADTRKRIYADKIKECLDEGEYVVSTHAMHGPDDIMIVGTDIHWWEEWEAYVLAITANGEIVKKKVSP